MGAARSQTGDHSGALSAFEKAAHSGGRFAVEAAYNAGLTATLVGAGRKAQGWLERLRVLPGAEMRSERLELEIVLAQAREGSPGAGEAVQAFLRKKSALPEKAMLGLSLAEWMVRRATRSAEEGAGAPGAALHETLREKAVRQLEGLASEPGAAVEALEYLGIYLETGESPAAAPRILDRAGAFLRQHPDSALCAEVSFLMGETLYRSGRYAEAEDTFLEAARGAVDVELRESALYVAGQCAAHSQGDEATGRALVHWDAVAQMGGRLVWKARYQQASLKCHMGDEREGILLYELILKSFLELDPELHFAARCGRADALFSLARRSRGSAEEAFKEYRVLAEVAKAAPAWRSQALYKAAKVLEETAPAESLAALRELAATPGAAGAPGELWVFRAGFDAARILEKNKQWEEAVALYEKMARRSGSRAQEAAARARQLRLEHFLWAE
jgi:tetratricopeptide (TPR) repeat protein